MNKIEQIRWNEMIEKHWWVKAHQHIAIDIIKVYLDKLNEDNPTCLDIGCSGGKISDVLGEKCGLTGFDLSFDALQIAKGKNIDVVQANAEDIPFKNNSFSLISAMEVLEHVDDDKKMISELKRVVKHGGYIFIMVPAYMSLWGSHDVRYSHKRRYNKKDLLDMANSNNLSIEKITFMHPHLLLPLFLIRWFDRMRKKKMGSRDDFMSMGKFLDYILYSIMMIERLICKYINFPFGTCIFAVFKKRAADKELEGIY